MKSRIALLTIFLAVVFSVSAYAAGTVVETIEYNQKGDFGHIVVLKYVCTADASAGTVPDKTISTFVVDDTTPSKYYGGVDIKNFYIYEIKTVPGTGGDQPDAYTVDIKDGDSASIVDIPNRSQTATEFVKGFYTLEIFPAVVEDLTLTVGDLGNSNKTTIYITLVK